MMTRPVATRRSGPGRRWPHREPAPRGRRFTGLPVRPPAWADPCAGSDGWRHSRSSGGIQPRMAPRRVIPAIVGTVTGPALVLTVHGPKVTDEQRREGRRHAT